MSEIKINNIPVITENNGSVSLTTGSVITDTIYESTAGSGVTIDGLKIKDTGIWVGGLQSVNIDSSGRVTMPYQPAFQVRLSSTQSISANVRTKIAFDTIDYQNGSGYDTANRRFTAPVTGFYQFNVIVYAYTVTSHEVTLWKNGSVYIRSQFENGASVNPTNGILVAATKLTADDYVEIYSSVTTSAAIYYSTERPTIWSGYLIG